MNKLITGCFGILMAATTLHAAQPMQSRYLDEFASPILCDGYLLTMAFSVDVHQTWFFDNDGSPRALHVNYQGDVAIYREGNPDNVLIGRRNDMQKADFVGGFSGGAINGGFIKVNLPGYGHLYFDAGRIEFDSNFNITHIRGANHDRFLGETDALCAYFQ